MNLQTGFADLAMHGQDIGDDPISSAQSTTISLDDLPCWRPLSTIDQSTGRFGIAPSNRRACIRSNLRGNCLIRPSRPFFFSPFSSSFLITHPPSFPLAISINFLRILQKLWVKLFSNRWLPLRETHNTPYHTTTTTTHPPTISPPLT